MNSVNQLSPDEKNTLKSKHKDVEEGEKNVFLQISLFPNCFVFNGFFQ